MGETPTDNELPGMWEKADSTGGQDPAAEAAQRLYKLSANKLEELQYGNEDDQDPDHATDPAHRHMVPRIAFRNPYDALGVCRVLLSTAHGYANDKHPDSRNTCSYLNGLGGLILLDLIVKSYPDFWDYRYGCLDVQPNDDERLALRLITENLSSWNHNLDHLEEKKFLTLL